MKDGWNFSYIAIKTVIDFENVIEYFMMDIMNCEKFIEYMEKVEKLAAEKRKKNNTPELS